MKAPLFTDTITLYNHYREGRVDHWHRTVLNCVQWTQKTVRTASNNGSVVVTTETSITIPNRGGYAKPIDFAQAVDKTDLWTLAPDDLILLGESIVEVVNEVTADDLGALGAVVIRSVKDNTLRPQLKHWKVVAI